MSEALAVYPVPWIAKSGFLPRRKGEIIKRMLQYPVLTFGRGTAPQRAIEHIVTTFASQADTPVGQTRVLCSPSVAAIVQLVRDGYGVAAIPALFVANEIKNGTFIELPIQPTPPSIVLSMCRHADAQTHVHARLEAHTSELQSLMRSSYAVLCLKQKKTNTTNTS